MTKPIPYPTYLETLAACRKSGNAKQPCDPMALPPSMRKDASKHTECLYFGGYCSVQNCAKWGGKSYGKVS